jgi:transposase-like protein
MDEAADDVESEADAPVMDALVYCPYCAEPVEISLDPGGGTHQRYIQDCEVCCQPWQVDVSWTADGAAWVDVTAADGR